MLLGLANNGTWGWPNGEEYITRYYGAFIQDDYKITSRLTMNIGLRWKMMQTPTFPDPQNQTVARYLNPLINDISPARKRSLFPKNGSIAAAFRTRTTSRSSAWRTASTTRRCSAPAAGIYYGEPDNPQSEVRPLLHRSAERGRDRAGQLHLVHLDADLRAGRSASVPDRRGAAGRGACRSRMTRSRRSTSQWFFDLQREMPRHSAHFGLCRHQVDPHVDGPQPEHALHAGPDDQREPAAHLAAVRRRNPARGDVERQLSFTAKAEKRFTKGFTFLSSFTWSHNINYGNENLEQDGSAAPSSTT
ncbi:MAG: hypothetical protein R2748_03055 [Bryobacterales bacterium]